MRPRSETFDAAAAQGHRIHAQATLLTPAGDEVDLPIGAGSQVTLDGTAATRASLTLNIPTDDLADIPDAPEDALAPYGSEITIVSGLTTPDGETEPIQIGIFGIDEVRIADSGGLDLDVFGLDRSAKVIDAVFEEPGTIAQGTNALAAARTVVLEALPTATFNFVDSDVTLPLLSYEAGDDRWDFAQGCAEAAQCLLYFDAEGICIAEPMPSGVTTDLIVSEGEDGTLLSIEKSLSRENACNRVVVTGENPSGDPVSGEAVDLVTTSPTYYYGPFGKVTFSYSSPYITEADQAQHVAENILRMRRGVSRQVNFESLVNPALEPFDVVRVTRERLKVDENHVIESLTLPLDHDGQMGCSTRFSQTFGEGWW